MIYHDRFIRACQQQPVDRLPVWYMRQAGRYDPEYRIIKEKYSLLEICRQPDLAAKVTMMPVDKLGVDAAILYSDIMNPVASLGIAFDVVTGVGPVIHQPIRSAKDVERLKPFDPEGDLGHILETIRILNSELKVPLIIFAGAPFTIASYLIEGQPSKSHLRTKTMMYEAPDIWFSLMNKLGDMVVHYVRAQIAQGGKAFQLFDSWAGCLSPRDFTRYVLPIVEHIYAQLTDLNVPGIYFPGVSSGELLPYLRQLHLHVISLDWRVSIAEGRRRLHNQFAVQGNLDPYLLTGPMDIIKREAAHIINEGLQGHGYIFNLGHGLFPEVSLDKLKQLTEFVQTYSAEVIAASNR